MLRVISVTFGHTTELEVSIGSFILQTNPNWTLEIVHDGPAPKEVREIMSRYSGDARIFFYMHLRKETDYGGIQTGRWLWRI